MSLDDKINPTTLFILVDLVNDIKKKSKNPKWTVDALYLSEYALRIKKSLITSQIQEELEKVMKKVMNLAVINGMTTIEAVDSIITNRLKEQKGE